MENHLGGFAGSLAADFFTFINLGVSNNLQPCGNLCVLGLLLGGMKMHGDSSSNERIGT